jgi:prolyl-tRNA synthetase
MARTGLTSQATDFSKWYNEVIIQSKLADYSPVKGCMVIRPHGYGLWERLQSELDAMIKETGHENAYFPLFIPESFFTKEAEHVEGFAPECAVVTHGGGKELEEKLMVRPTSETMIHSMVAKWINSYRDLPMLLNQWANVVRWEMRTRLFLRTTEFLWQEGHTAHATAEEAEEETLKILDMYASLAEDIMAVPVIKGKKTEKEKFAGARWTYCIEAMMKDGKALQAGTSHNLGQNFAKAFNIRFQSKSGSMEHVWQTSWGVSTRLIGALVMAHGDDKGLVLPPKMAPIQAVLVPIWKTDVQRTEVLQAVDKLTDGWKQRWRFKVDDREGYSPGWKFHEWELAGVPVRIELGPKDLEKQQAMLARRDTSEKAPVAWDDLTAEVERTLEAVQTDMLQSARERQEANTHSIDDYAEFKERLAKDNLFVQSHWCGNQDCEDQVQEETKATIACMPFESIRESGKCLVCGAASEERVVFAKSY